MGGIKNWLYFSLEELIDMETNETEKGDNSPYDRANVTPASNGSTEPSTNDTE